MLAHLSGGSITSIPLKIVLQLFPPSQCSTVNATAGFVGGILVSVVKFKAESKLFA